MSENVEFYELQFKHKFYVILMAFHIVKINGACTYTFLLWFIIKMNSLAKIKEDTSKTARTTAKKKKNSVSQLIYRKK